MSVWIDGEESADGRISVSDHALLRGDACFEALRVYRGCVFALEEHLGRLQRSVMMMDLECPSTSIIAQWVKVAAKSMDEGAIRVVVTRGDPTESTKGHVVVLTAGLPELPRTLRFRTVIAPWHSAGRSWSLAGAKTTSYAPNMAAVRDAQRAGADDAILLSEHGVLLEGPTFTIGWFREGVLETPSLDLLILDSITRRHALAVAEELGIEIRPGRFEVGDLVAADEVFALSTFKEVTPVVEVDDTAFSPGPLTLEMSAAYRRRVENSLAD